MRQIAINAVNEIVFFQIYSNSESEWMFGTPKGRKEFHSKYLAYNRVTYIMLSRAYEYTTWNDISDELHEALGRFAPGKAVTKTVIPPFSAIANGSTKLSSQWLYQIACFSLFYLLLL